MRAFIFAGNTPLHLALESGHAEVAVKLIEAGADRDRVRAAHLIIYHIRVLMGWCCRQIAMGKLRSNLKELADKSNVVSENTCVIDAVLLRHNEGTTRNLGKLMS